jgi:hypothetical protein
MSLPSFSYKPLMLAAATFCLAAGCQSQPKAPPPILQTPALSLQINHYTGTPLSGPRLDVADVGLPADALTVSIQWIAATSMPPSLHETLASQCRLIIAGQSGSPMLASPQLTKDVLFDQTGNVASLAAQFSKAPTADVAPIVSLEAALPPKVTLVFSATTTAPPPPRNQIILRMRRAELAAAGAAAPNAGKSIQMTLELSEDRSTTTQPSILSSETAVFDRLFSGGHDQIAIAIPMQFSDSTARALIALIDISPTATAGALARCHADLQSAAEAAAKQPSIAAVEGSAWAGYDSALKALWQPATRRAALVFLASQTSAHICEDTALVADDATLEKLANNIAGQAAATTEPHTSAALEWLLDRAAFNLLVLSDAPPAGGAGNGTTSAPLPPELVAVLTVYAGEPARHGGSLDDIAHEATSRKDLENRLTAENLVFLTDSSPASRVRAFDWLKARGLAPAGYDPLGPEKQRREAMDRALATDSD